MLFNHGIPTVLGQVENICMLSGCFHSGHFHTLNWKTKDCNFSELRLGEVSMPHVFSGLGLGLGIKLSILKLCLAETDCRQLSSCFRTSSYILFKGFTDLPKSYTTR